MNIKMSWSDRYEKHGCHFYGNIVNFEYSDDLIESQKQTIGGGFARGKCFDYVDLIRKYLKINNINYETCLAIPDFVIKVDDENFNKLKNWELLINNFN